MVSGPHRGWCVTVAFTPLREQIPSTRAPKSRAVREEMTWERGPPVEEQRVGPNSPSWGVESRDHKFTRNRQNKQSSVRLT